MNEDGDRYALGTMKDTELNVMSLNTWGFRWPLSKDRPLRFGRISHHLTESAYDIVALQEMWDGARETLGQTGHSWLQRPLTMTRTRGRRMVDSGLAVKLSHGLRPDANVRDDMATAFGRHQGWDRLKKKGVHAVDVQVGDSGIVTVLNTHLQASAHHAHTRRAQLDELLEAAERSTHPIILMGDFNFHDDHPEDRAGQAALEREGFLDVASACDVMTPTYHTANPYVPSGDQDARFDRIFVRSGTTASLEPLDFGVLVNHHAPLSDHEAVTARLSLRNLPLGE